MFKCKRGVETATGCDGGVETVVVMAVGAAVLVAAVVMICLVSGEKSGEGMREIGRAAEAMVGEDGLRCEGWAALWWRGVVHLVAVLAASWLSSRMGLERGLRLRRPTTITLSGVEVKRGGDVHMHPCLCVCVCVCVCARTQLGAYKTSFPTTNFVRTAIGYTALHRQQRPAPVR